MSQVTTPAIILRRIEYGDFDLIITFFSRDNGKISLMAKSAKKSKKRFAGILEPFSVLQIVYGRGRGKGLPILNEASLVQPFSHIRQDITRTAYASYMAELIYEWTEENHRQPPLFQLLQYSLEKLDQKEMPADALSVLFQMRFMALAGFEPNLRACVSCKKPVDNIDQRTLAVDLKQGGLICSQCKSPASKSMTLSKGTLKQLLWLTHADLEKATRVKMTSPAIREALPFLEAFVPFHLGKEPRSLKFIQQLRH